MYLMQVIRWLFFIEGGITILVALWSMSILPDFPETSFGWLTPAERALAMRRMTEDLGCYHEGNLLESKLHGKFLGRWPGLHLAVTDWKVWWLALTMTFMVLSLSFNSYFPTLSATLGYDTTTSLLLCVPPWLFATATSFALTRSVSIVVLKGDVVLKTMPRHSDRMEERSKHISFSLLIGALGFVLAMSTRNFMIRYVSL